VRTVQATLLALEIDADLTETVDFLRANLDELVYPPIRAGAVLALVRNGGADDVARHLADLVTHVVTDNGREASWLLTASFTADAVAAAGDAERAEQLLAVLSPYADRIAVDGVGFHCNGCLARPLARLAAIAGHDDLAASLRSTALERDTATGLRLWMLDDAIDDLAARAATGRLDLAEIRVRVGAIAEEATELGLTSTARRARALLRPRSAVELTERQRRVLAALAEGLTYQAAGERLGFSHSTIRHEAMRVYAALGATDRNEAVRLARAAGIVTDG
jgi:DNA-binding CsgD family transcriptional regulator